MRNIETSCLLLKTKYNLHNSFEVESAAKRTKLINGRKVPQNPLDRIQNYLDRFGEIINNENPTQKGRGIKAIKKFLYDKSVIKPTEIPESYFENQRRIAREQGHGDVQINSTMRKELADIIIADQKASLDNWIDYLSSPEAPYPNGLKYFTLRGVLDIGEYDKEKKVFAQRSKGTTKPFPDLNREALSYVLDVIDKKYANKPIDYHTLGIVDQKQFKEFLQSENFAKLYAWGVDKATPTSTNTSADIQGEWIKYPMGSDPKPLVASLQGYGTDWCTAGESTARAQLQGGDFYAYYSLNQNGKPTIPRVAIRMERGKIGEVRGVGPQQNLDRYIDPVVEVKMMEFPDGEAYKKKANDMKLLTEIEYKMRTGDSLNKNDLAFLYEVDSKIEGFGYIKDPRIKALRSRRNKEEDMSIFFECSRGQIAHHEGEINQDTKAYVGYLEPGIFDKLTLPIEEHSYAKFPEQKLVIRRGTIVVGGKTLAEFFKEMQNRNINFSQDVAKMMKSVGLSSFKEPRAVNLITLKVGYFGLEEPTTNNIYERARALGLELCPAGAALYYRLFYADQPIGEHISIAMRQIKDLHGKPSVLQLGNSKDDGLRLRSRMATPNAKWDPESKLVFSI